MNKTFEVTEQLINSCISKVEHHRLGKKMMVCLITTNNGHEVIGQSGIVDHRLFDEVVGKQWAFIDAKNNLVKLLAYQVQQDMYNHLLHETSLFAQETKRE